MQSSRYARQRVGQFGVQDCKGGGVRATAGAYHDIDGGKSRQRVAAQNLAETAAQTIAGHRTLGMAGYDDAHAGMAFGVRLPGEIEMRGAPALTLLPARRELRGAGETRAAREPLARYRLPRCLDGSRTVSCLRPFLRRRDSTARPHLSAMRARNPCLLMRRRLRGRYVGPIAASVRAGNLHGRARTGQG